MGVLRLCRSKQHVASASPGGPHWHPALRISAQLYSSFVTLVRPSLGLMAGFPQPVSAAQSSLPGGNQGSSTPQQAARSLSLTWSHPPASSSPHLCPTLFVLRNFGPARLGSSWPASLHRSRRLGRRSPGGNQGSSLPQSHQAARSLSLSRTRGHLLLPGSPLLCPALHALRNPGPTQSGPTCSPGPGHPDSSLQFFHSARWSRRPARLCTFKIVSPAPGRC
ncbi:hypothetical protein NDU88_005828 [Pleurodeles waltl]|uniref:Uncharacterized protein n=1 Tax=Pleurodeles waltl TaxID=8319 RepID=A0AAV7WZP2_PLEWA|nr:hypothetical protein NDU88_005828 [Pleurodeles waltl]